MNEIKLTVELCKEDRARLDAILAALQRQPQERPAEAPQAAQAQTPINTPPAQENDAPFDTAEPAAEKTVTHADVRQKVVTLSAAGKKAQVREIVKRYAEKVPEIPADKLYEVWEQLNALEG